MSRRRSEKEYILLALCATLGSVIIPFAVIRFLAGEYPIALLDTVLMIGMGFIFVYVWTTGRVEIPGYIAAVVFILGTIATVHLRGIDQVHWAYPAYVIIFYFLQPRLALTLGSIGTAAIMPTLLLENPPLPVFKVFMTLVVTVFCAFIFASVTQRQSETLQKLSQRDPLTQIGNRGAMDVAIHAVFLERQKHIQPPCALMIDIDHFKPINDRYGHQTGDIILKSVAAIIKNNVRSSEHVYRYGGEEFLVITRDLAVEDVHFLADRLRAKIAATEFDRGINISISVGIAALEGEDTAQSWLEKADAALYRAKDEGRDRVVLHRAD